MVRACLVWEPNSAFPVVAKLKLWGVVHQRQDSMIIVYICKALFKEEFLQFVVTSFFLLFFKISS